MHIGLINCPLGASPNILKLGCVCKPLRPQENGRNGQHCRIIDRTLFVAGRNPPKLFDAANHALNFIPLPVDLLVKGAPPALITAASDRHSNASPSQIGAKCSRCVTFITHNTARPYSGPTLATPHSALFHQLFGHRDLVRLTRCQQKSHDLSATVHAHMDLCGQSTSRVAQGFLF